jgi:hypothetical protein
MFVLRPSVHVCGHKKVFIQIEKTHTVAARRLNVVIVTVFIILLNFGSTVKKIINCTVANSTLQIKSTNITMKKSTF